MSSTKSVRIRKSGWLYRESGKRGNSWNLEWAVLTSQSLQFFSDLGRIACISRCNNTHCVTKTPGSGECLLSLSIDGCVVGPTKSARKDKHAFRLSLPKTGVKGQLSKLILAGESEAKTQEWMEIFQSDGARRPSLAVSSNAGGADIFVSTSQSLLTVKSNTIIAPSISSARSTKPMFESCIYHAAHLF